VAAGVTAANVHNKAGALSIQEQVEDIGRLKKIVADGAYQDIPPFNNHGRIEWDIVEKKAGNCFKVLFDDIEQTGVKSFLQSIQEELINNSYQPVRNRIKEIPKANGKTRKLGIPTIKDRVVQGAVKLIIEPVFEADFQEGSYGYRPKRTAHQAIEKLAEVAVKEKTRVTDLDLKSYFDTVKHPILLDKVAKRIADAQSRRQGRSTSGRSNVAFIKQHLP
jgi:hypothetical protein